MEAVFLHKRFIEVDDLLVNAMSCGVMDDYEMFITAMCANPFVPGSAPPVKDMLIPKPNGEFILTSAAKTRIFTSGPISLCIKFELAALSGTAQVGSVAVNFDTIIRHYNDIYVDSAGLGC